MSSRALLGRKRLGNVPVDFSALILTETFATGYAYARTFSVSPDESYLIYTTQATGIMYKFLIPDIVDISTMNYDSEKSAAGDLRGSVFSADGSKFLVGRSTFNQYSVNPVWTSSTLDGTKVLDSTVQGMFLAGNLLFTVDNAGIIRRYTLTSGDSMTATLADQIQPFSENTYGISFRPDGMEMYVGTFSGDLRKYTLSAPYDILSAVYVELFSFGGNLFDFYIAWDKRRVLLTDALGNIKGYDY